jgi:hypothetical protein
VPQLHNIPDRLQACTCSRWQLSPSDTPPTPVATVTLVHVQVLYIPAPGEHVVRYKRHVLWIVRERESNESSSANKRLLTETLHITLLGRQTSVCLPPCSIRMPTSGPLTFSHVTLSGVGLEPLFCLSHQNTALAAAAYVINHEHLPCLLSNMPHATMHHHWYAFTLCTPVGTQQVVKELIDDARALYLNSLCDRTCVYTVDGDGFWMAAGARPSRPLSSVVLPHGVAKALHDDCADFLAGEEWYTQHGVPYRRGYLLFGPPGTGAPLTPAVEASTL